MIRKFLASVALVSALAVAGAPAQAEDTLSNSVTVKLVQKAWVGEQWTVGAQWADTNGEWGKITQDMSNTNALGISDINVETNISDCNCFNDVSNSVNANLDQDVGSDLQVAGGLQVALTDANIGQTMENLNVGVANTVSSSVNPDIDLP